MPIALRAAGDPVHGVHGHAVKTVDEEEVGHLLGNTLVPASGGRPPAYRAGGASYGFRLF